MDQKIWISPQGLSTVNCWYWSELEILGRGSLEIVSSFNKSLWRRSAASIKTQINLMFLQLWCDLLQNNRQIYLLLIVCTLLSTSRFVALFSFVIVSLFFLDPHELSPWQQLLFPVPTLKFSSVSPSSVLALRIMAATYLFTRLRITSCWRQSPWLLTWLLHCLVGISLFNH